MYVSVLFGFWKAILVKGNDTAVVSRCFQGFFEFLS